jgi:membrane protein DedA with SNARE-associated domain
LESAECLKTAGLRVAEFWEQWGALAYAAAALWAFFEGETFVLAAAAIGATLGGIDPWLLMLSVWAGSFAGDQTWYTLGRRFGPALLKRFPAAGRKAASAADLLERHGALFVLTYRFLYGIRNVAAAACGLSGMPRRRFMALNLAGAGIWASSFVAAGWFVGGLLGPETLGYLIASAGLLLLLMFIIRYWRRRRGAIPPAGVIPAPIPVPAHVAVQRSTGRADPGM